MKLKKLTALTLVVTSVLTMAACGGNNNSAANDTKQTDVATEQTGATEAGDANAVDEDAPVEFSVSDWPDDTNPDWLANREALKDQLEEMYPNITLVGDTFAYKADVFAMKAAADQLPNLYSTWFTETKNIISQGYAADITDIMKEKGYDKLLNPQVLDLVTDDEGRIYGMPLDAYQMALVVNKELFEQAGLVNDDGSLMFPDTWDELAEYAQIIKEKTGKAGLAFPTTENCGGWISQNIAYGYGVEYEKKNDDGTWTATFDTQEAKDTLQYIKDLKWEYDGLLDDAVVSLGDALQYFGTGQAGMLITSLPFEVVTYGMDISNVAATKMPAGPAGRYAQMGGNVYMFSRNSTPEQIAAGFKWIELNGKKPELTDEEVANARAELEGAVADGRVVLPKEPMSIWQSGNWLEERNKLREELANTDYEDYKTYYEADDLTVVPEPSACAQELYSVWDGIIQEVITNKDADVDALVAGANSDFQTNYLDKME